VEEAIRTRFDDVIQRIEVPLIEYVRRNKRKHSPIAIRLVVLGMSEEDAKAWIVVFCDEKQSKRLKRFFGREFVKQMYQPGDKSLPQFEVHVEGRAPQLRKLTVWRETKSPMSDTLCGTIIMFKDMEETSVEGHGKRAGENPVQIATFGGLVKVVAPNNSYLLYGMTAGHVTREREDSAYQKGGEYSDEESEESSEEYFDELPNQVDASQNYIPYDIDNVIKLPNGVVSRDERMETVLGDEPPTTSVVGKDHLDDSPLLNSSAMVSRNWKLMGAALPAGNSETFKHQDYDWTFIEIDNCELKPNLLRTQSVLLNRSADLKVPSQPLKGSERPSVVMLSGPQGSIPGSLSALPSKLLLGTGSKFVDTYILNLDGHKSMHSSIITLLAVV
jgi:hypothetical protein